MKATISETSESIEYTVIDREAVSDETLQGMYYNLKDGRYTKVYSKERLMFPQDLALMEKNYNAYLPNELHQENRTANDLESALEWLCREFKQRGIRWWLAGSGALYARGLSLKPHDLDVMTYKTEIGAICGMVAPYIVEPFHHVTGWVVKGFGVVNYRYRIDFAFEPEDWVDGEGAVDFGPYAQAHLETINWRGYEIAVPPIELHIGPNEARGRHARVEQIHQYLAAKQAG